MTRNMMSFALAAMLVMAIGGCGKKGSDSCMNPTAPNCDGGETGNTAQIQNVEPSIPSGTVLEVAQNIPYSLTLTFDLPSTEYVSIVSCMSMESGILTHGCGMSSSRDVASWRRENPIRLEAYCGCGGQPETFISRYLHVFVLRGGLPPSVIPGTSVADMKAKQNFLDHREMEWTITILPKK